MTQRGQAGLLMVMVMAAVGVLAVGVASRGVETLKTQDVDNDSSLARQAAEAGLDVARKDKANATETLTGSSKNVSFNATYNSENTPQSPFVEEGDVAQLLLSGYTGTLSTVTIYWNETANVDPGSPAIFVSLVTGNPTTAADYGFRHYQLDPDNGRATSTNHFTYNAPGSYTYQGINYRNRYSIDMTTIPSEYLLRVTPLYKNSRIAFEAAGAGLTLPTQRVRVTSVGAVDNNGKRVEKRLTYDEYSDRVPLVFSHLLYTNGSISQ